MNFPPPSPTSSTPKKMFGYVFITVTFSYLNYTKSAENTLIAPRSFHESKALSSRKGVMHTIIVTKNDPGSSAAQMATRINFLDN